MSNALESREPRKVIGMLTLGLALVVLGSFGLALRGVRRLWPGAITRFRIVLLQLALVGAWVFGGNLLGELRERRVRDAWTALDPAALAVAKTAEADPNRASVELVRLAVPLGIHLVPGAAKSAPRDRLSEVGLAGLGPYLDGASRQPDDRIGRAPAELRAWLVLQDAPARAVCQEPTSRFAGTSHEHGTASRLIDNENHFQ